MASITYETCICLLYIGAVKFYCDFLSNNMTIPKPREITERKLECPYTYLPLPCEFEIFLLFISVANYHKILAGII